MASITTRGGKFFARIRREGTTTAKTFAKRSDAVAWARKIESEIERGAWVPPALKAPSLASAIIGYRAAVAVNLKGLKVYDCYFAEFTRQAFAAKPINEITAFDIAAWRDCQLQRSVNGTVTRKLASLGAIFTWAIRERGWLDINPMTRVTKPRVADARDRLMTVEEQRYLLSAADSSRAGWLAPALRALMFSAMRRGELFGLRRKDVDFDAATAFLPETKAGGSRLVPLAPDALKALRCLVDAAAKGQDTPLLPVAHVVSISDVFKSTVSRARRQYDADCKASGVQADVGFLTDLRLHTLRHQAISRWAETGELTLPELMAVSGHRDPRQAMRYTHLSVTKLASKMATISLGVPA